MSFTAALDSKPPRKKPGQRERVGLLLDTLPDVEAAEVLEALENPTVLIPRIWETMAARYGDLAPSEGALYRWRRVRGVR